MRKFRDCEVCGEQFEIARYCGMAKTCGPECGHELMRKRHRSEPYLKYNRERQRRVRATDPADYVENRDPAAMKERERERWRRGQAARRSRMREGVEHDGA